MPGTLREMMHIRRTRSAPWYVAILVSVLVLGHVCDVPALAEAVTHAAGAGHQHATDAHPGQSQVSCDAVDATTCLRVALDLDTPGALVAVDGPVPMRWVAAAPPAPSGPPLRPPLFLLHASFLI
jgi:hypothetical protein